jgi:Fic family protein
MIDRYRLFLKIFSRFSDPFYLFEIMQHLRNADENPDQIDFSERTVRRWLVELIHQGKVEKTGHTKSAQYRWISENREKETYAFDPISVTEYLSKPLFDRKLASYQLDWLESYEPNVSRYFDASELHVLMQCGSYARESEWTEGSLVESDQMAGTYARKIYNRLLIDLSYNSSRLEGNTYSLVETEKLILEGIESAQKLDAERVMILNHKEAIRYLVDNAFRIEPSPQEIKTLHYLLSEGLIASKDSGRIRDQGVKISGTTYLPLESPVTLENILAKMSEKAMAIQNPFEQSLFLLVHLAYLQGFIDVNKRTARLAANIPLIKHNRVPLSFNDVNKEEYLTAMIAIYELNHVELLKKIYIKSYIRTCEAYRSIADAVGFDETRIRYRAERRALVQKIILNAFEEQAIRNLIHQEAQKIEPRAREAFIEDVKEDLYYLGPQKIAGLGISQTDLQVWLGHVDPQSIVSVFSGLKTQDSA